jgi:hypothetical protein
VDAGRGHAVLWVRIVIRLIPRIRICAVQRVSDSNFLPPKLEVGADESAGDGCGYNVTRGDNRCAVDSWVLFTTNKEPICCMPGEQGTNAAPTENYGHCLQPGVSVPSASLATLVCSS